MLGTEPMLIRCHDNTNCSLNDANFTCNVDTFSAIPATEAKVGSSCVTKTNCPDAGSGGYKCDINNGNVCKCDDGYFATILGGECSK